MILTICIVQIDSSKAIIRHNIDFNIDDTNLLFMFKETELTNHDKAQQDYNINDILTGCIVHNGIWEN